MVGPIPSKQIQADWLTSKKMQDLRSFALEYAKQIVAKANELVNSSQTNNNGHQQQHEQQIGNDFEQMRLGSQKQRISLAASELNERLKQLFQQTTNETSNLVNNPTFYCYDQATSKQINQDERTNNNNKFKQTQNTHENEFNGTTIKSDRITKEPSLSSEKKQRKNQTTRFVEQDEEEKEFGLNSGDKNLAQTKQPAKFNEHQKQTREQDYEYNYSGLKQQQEQSQQHTTYTNPITSRSVKQNNITSERSENRTDEGVNLNQNEEFERGTRQKSNGFNWHPLISCISTCLPHILIDNLPLNLRPKSSRRRRQNSDNDLEPDSYPNADPYAD